MAKAKGLLKEVDPRIEFFKRLKELVNFNAIKKANLKIAVDLLYGTGIGYLDETLRKAGPPKDTSQLEECIF